MSMMTMFMEENRRRDEEREERFLKLLQSIQPQTKAVTAVEGKSDLLPELMREITQFSYDPESGTPFSTWMGRFEAVLGNHGMQLSDHDKTGALLSKLDLETYNSYTDHIMPRTPGSLSYEETKEVLEDMLGDKISVFRRRIDVMRLAIGNLTFRKLRSTINRMVALAQFDSLTKENFKCLIYISALQGTKYADIRTRLLSKLEKQEGCTLADLVNEYRRSTHFGQADALSRLIASKKLPEDEDIVIAKIEQDVRAVQGDVIRHLPVTKEDIRRMTEEDSEFQLVVEAVSTGRWPKFQAGSTLHAFHSRSADLSVYEGALFMGTRAVIPPALRSRVLKMLHEGHPGVTRMKMLARRYVYWQGIDRDIEDRVKFCSSCQLAAKMLVRNELSPWPTPDCAWERIHIDFAGPMEGMMFLIVVDAFSKWPEVVQMRTSTTTATIKELGRIFAQQGYPKVLVSDNGTQFTAKEFQDYCQKNGI